jgi:hypothetical protein
VKVSDAFPSHYLKAGDLGGRVVPVTISHVKSELVGREKEPKLVVYFEGKDKGVVLNKTNARKIVEISGSDDTDDWTGIKIALYSAEVEFQGDTVQSIRVRAAQNVAAAARRPEPPPLSDEDIPF